MKVAGAEEEERGLQKLTTMPGKEIHQVAAAASFSSGRTTTSRNRISYGNLMPGSSSTINPLLEEEQVPMEY